jgi:excisionase family DNA binding protein
MVEKSFLTVEEVAKRFEVNSSTIYRLAQQGLIPGFKIGSQWRFSQEMLDKWVLNRVSIEQLRKEDEKKSS